MKVFRSMIPGNTAILWEIFKLWISCNKWNSPSAYFRNGSRLGQKFRQYFFSFPNFQTWRYDYVSIYEEIFHREIFKILHSSCSSCYGEVKIHLYNLVLGYSDCVVRHFVGRRDIKHNFVTGYTATLGLSLRQVKPRHQWIQWYTDLDHS